MASQITIITSGINRLAKVEVELIMQFLDLKSLVKIARCSKRLYDDANSKESFKMLPAINLYNICVTAPQKLMLNHSQLQFEGNVNCLDIYPLEIQNAISTLSLGNCCYNSDSLCNNCSTQESEDNDELQQLQNFLIKNTNLTTLKLHNNNQYNYNFETNSGYYIESYIESCIGNIITTCKGLKTLQLCTNKINDAGVVAIAESMKVNCTLTSLNLRCNKICNAGVVTLCESMKVNCTLTSLDLNYNNIDDIGGVAVGAFLKVNCTLTSLDLSDNEIRDIGGAAIAEGMMANYTIKSLDLSNNRISNAIERVIDKAIIANNAGNV